MRGSAIWLLLLSQAANVLGTNAQYYHEQHGDGTARREPKPHGLGPKTDVATDQAQPPVRQPGAEFVEAALSQLQKVSRSSTHYRRKQPSGVAGTVLQYILKALPTGPAAAPTQNHPKTTVSGPAGSAVELLNQAAQHNNSDALYLLAELNFFGNFSHPRDLHAAYNYYSQLASAHGNTTAQYMLGLYHSTGVGNVVPKDQAKALLYYTFAAIRGDTRAEMATAFRHYSGIGASKSCETAVKYYKRVADKAIQWYRSGPPGGKSWIYQNWRIADDDGGVYGEGASAASSGINARKVSVHSDANAAISDVIEYLDLMSQKGDAKASLNLGRIFYDGQRGLDQDFDLARKYFFLVASKFWRKDGRKNENVKPGTDKIAAKAAGFIGRMYLRGDGCVQNFERAKMWFERGKEYGDAQSQWGLGLMLLNGYGGTENIQLASELLQVAANQDFGPAQVQIGRLFLDQGETEDLRMASNFFELAARFANLEAHYYLAEMVYHGVGREKLCNTALSYYKNVAERAEPLLSSWADANDAYEAGDHEVAFLEYLMAAEQGYERAQNNVAYMLDAVYSKLNSPRWLPKQPRDEDSLLDNPGLALVYWTRSSRQANVDSMVKMGDYYFYGIGTDVDVGKAVQCYTGASDYSQSAQALFNLGWMHENGVGLKQDFHMAKRYYDHALQLNDEAYLPVTLSLLKLRLRSAWNTLTHGEIHSIQDEPSKVKDWSLAEWITNFFQDDNAWYEDGELYEDLIDDTIGLPDDEDYLDAGGIVESMLIIGVTFSLVFLLWWRQRIQQAHARVNQDQQQQQQQQQQQAQQAQQAQQQQQQQQPGIPGNGFDGFAGWAAGGVGL